MIDLSRSASASSDVHAVVMASDTSWVKDAALVVDVPPDGAVDPMSEARWPGRAARTGVYGAVGPRVIALPNGGFRLYYTQLMPRFGFPAGANDYENAATRILSLRSADGSTWIPEPGVRLSCQQVGAGYFHMVSTEIVPMPRGDGRLRMYYQCGNDQESRLSSIRSAVSDDGGIAWTPEPGVRFGTNDRSYISPRIVFLEDGRWRLYCCERGQGIISALSDDGGMTFRRERGLRIAQDGAYDAHVAYAPEIMRVDGGAYVMYYAGYGAANRACILRATSDDGLTWRKEPEPILSPTSKALDAAKCSEMSVFRLPRRTGQSPRYRMVYEACDGTATGKRGVWRLASATSAAY
jgi:hypothetical protein